MNSNEIRKQTSWQNLSKWYDALIGDEGSELHKRVIVPELFELVKIKPGMKVLDVGCGNGVLAKDILKFGASYTGIDSSIILVESAKKRSNNNAKFIISDICNPNTINLLNNTQFDIALFVLSIQDINPINEAIQNLSKLLKYNGVVFIFMLHPAFKTPRQTGFVYDEGRKMISRRVDSYLTHNNIPFKKDKQNRRYVADFYHRPLQTYVNTLSDNGIFIKNLYEIPTYKNNDSLSRTERRVLKEIPVYMVIKAHKMGSSIP